MMAKFQVGNMTGAEPNLLHGHNRRGATTKTYRAWVGMHKRCSNPAYQHYAEYGGRGISVCERWGDFRNFLADMGEAPLGRSLDRKDNNKGYSLRNCRWATRVEQAQNKRNNRLLEFEGETLCLCEWARRTMQSAPTLCKRLKRGWSVEEALTGRRAPCSY